jgi:hypothetical protein
VSAYLPGAAGPGDFAADLEAAGLRPDEPGLGDLLGALTAPPSAGELTGEQAALAMFRANLGVSATAPHRALPRQTPPQQAVRPQTPSQQAPRPQTPPRQTPPRVPKRYRSAGWRMRIGFAAAAVLTAAGTVSAAYAAALPPPVQHFAYQVLGFAGVPDSRHAGPGQSGHKHPGVPPSAPATGHGAGPGSQAPTQPGGGSPAPSSPRPRPSGHEPAPAWHLSIAASQHQIAAGGTADLIAGVTQGDHHVSGATVRLLERPAGQVSWRSAGTARTTADGQAAVRVSDLRVNADFRFTGATWATGARSATVTVTVVPAVTLQPSSQPGGHRRTALIARSPLAGVGDMVVLQLQSGSSWVNLKSRRLDLHGRRIFLISSQLAAGRTFRVTLPATSTHAASVSAPLTVP